MQDETSFKSVGKQMPYQTPAGFFDRISEETLTKAKQRESKRLRTRNIWRNFSAAASIAALFFIGFFLLENHVSNHAKLSIMEMEPAGQQTSQVTTRPQQAVGTVSNEARSDGKQEAEAFSDVLADLPDEELSKIAATLPPDPFIGEPAQ